MGSTRRRTTWAVVAALAVVAAATQVPLLDSTLRAGGASGASAPPGPPGPLDVRGDLDGAVYRFVVPERWNGTLLVFAHGYRAAGVDEDRRPALVPTHADRAALMRAGYALAGTAYRHNGWALDVAVDDVDTVAQLFAQTVARPRRVLAWGESMGGLVVAAALEAHPDTFDGGLSVCGILGGATAWWDTNGMALALAYDAAFGWPAAWGPLGSPRADLDFWSEVAPLVADQIEDPGLRPRWEFVRLVVGAPGADFYAGGALLAMDLATAGRADLAGRAGGQALAAPPGGYRLAPEDAADLATQGIDVVPLLGHMNAAPPATDAAARTWLSHHVDPTGALADPLLALHTEADTVVPGGNLAAYASRVEAAGAGERIVAATLPGSGHCTFRAGQLTAAVAALDAWVGDGSVPEPQALAPLG
jgi:alpha-beta hydrolase superfamily lysophospholipase